MELVIKTKMFKVKATVVNFLGNQELYPCHMGHKIGDEVIFDGESYHGRLCPDVWPLIAPKVSALHAAGPRFTEPAAYYPFWYCSPSFKDASQKKYDGLGFRNNLTTIVPARYDMANMVPPTAFKWPAHDKRDILVGSAAVTCPDTRTSMVMMLTAFDLSDRGFDIPFFRRQMAILKKLKAAKEIPAEKILKAFTKSQIESIYPPLNDTIIEILVEELVLMDYVVIKDGIASITPKGKAKLKDFMSTLPEEDREIFENY